MADSCIISKDQLSQKELALKSRLYGIQPTQQSKPLPTTNKGFQPPGKTATPEKIIEHHKTNLKAVTDAKMDTFLDEMRN